jgi:hypothetical protein
MTTQELEQITNEATENFVIVSCECGSPLVVPKDIYKKLETSRNNPEAADLLGKQYLGFYVSPEKSLFGSMGYFCNESHLRDFTDD